MTEARRNTGNGTASALQYYDEVIGQLGEPEALLIFGPGEAKLELEERLSRSKTFSERTVDIETADKLTYPQLWRE